MNANVSFTSDSNIVRNTHMGSTFPFFQEQDF